ncbi:MAG: PEP-CTERM sorting domain-containing protein [Phycisphaerae bacterium]
MKKFLAVSAVIGCTGFAMADTLTRGPVSYTQRTETVGSSYTPSPDLSGIVIPFDVTGIQSFDAPGAPGNTIVLLDAAAAAGLPSGTQVEMNGVGWDVVVESFGASWLSELGVAFGPQGGVAEINLRPGAGSNAPGGPTPFTSGGIIKFDTIPLPNIVLPNGMLQMEFFESFDDVAGAVDGQWVSGSLNIQVTPEPASLSLLSLGALALLRRR